MPELDLIPSRYSGTRKTRNWVFAACATYIAIAASIVGLRIYLEHSIDESHALIESLESETQRAEKERRERDRLLAERDDLKQRLSILAGLRGGIAAKEMFSVVDDALDERIWFRSWSFRRAGEIVAIEPDAVETGYFIVLPKTAPDEPGRAWRLETHMEIGADSEDHTSLASFVRRLSQQPEVENARILSTRHRPTGSGRGDHVGFELAVLVRSAP